MQGYGKRILIIDDANDVRYLTSMALQMPAIMSTPPPTELKVWRL